LNFLINNKEVKNMRRYMPAKPEPNGFKFKNGNPYI